ncbi:MAG: hypothetical protein EAX95_09185 [Candidatus Thorarchaeota archaeon]|nr:hypothetical protein [Candidatus Thorarchaeota archaeon]
MQDVFDITIYSNLAAAILSVVVSFYLFYIWRRQENRLYTDLPLVFSISFLVQSMNTGVLALSTMGVLTVTIELFRFRAILIGTALIPLSVILLTIWLPRFERYYAYVIAFLAAYALAIPILGPTQELIMILVIPVILVILLGLIITFAVTWKTGRLKEVRSDLMVLSLILMVVSQTAKVPLAAMGLVVLPDLITALSTIIAALAITNPWAKRIEPTLEPAADY